MKKVLALVLALAMIMMVGAALAQEKASGMGGNATITITNAAKDETYKVVKLFDATVTGTADGSIAYTGTIPTALANYFEADGVGNISLKKIADASGKNPGDDGYVDTYYNMTANDFLAMRTWADGIADDDTTYPSAKETSDGSVLKFTGLKYGYYVVVSSQGTLVTVDSTNPNATVIDKNDKIPTAGKTVNDTDVHVGETVTYTLTFGTANYNGEKAIVEYVITDTLPNYLEDVNVTSVTIGGADYKVGNPAAYPQFDANKTITIPWATEETDGSYKSIYSNGAQIVITYTAKVNANVNVGNTDGNRNVVTLTPHDKEGKNPWEKPFHSETKIYTYGAAIKKVDEAGNLLPGAEFAIKGMTVTGSAGKYTVASYDASSTTYSDSLACDSEGYLYILGLGSDETLTAMETVAPNGYNKLAGTFTVTPIKMSETTTYTDKVVYYDAAGNVVHEDVTGGTSKTVTANYSDLKTQSNVCTVENKKGTELPATGGIGTTIFYVLGGLLVVGAAVILVARRKAHD